MLPNSITKNWTEEAVRKHILALFAKQYLSGPCLEQIRKISQRWNTKNVKTYSTNVNVEFKREEPVQTRSKIQKYFRVNI